jgi:hypothetical protein
MTPEIDYEKESASSEYNANNGEDIDMTYDQIRDEDSIKLDESVKDLIIGLSKLLYYKNRKEGLAQDIIHTTLNELNLKMVAVNNTEGYQELILIDKETNYD